MFDVSPHKESLSVNLYQSKSMIKYVDHTNRQILYKKYPRTPGIKTQKCNKCRRKIKSDIDG